MRTENVARSILCLWDDQRHSCICITGHPESGVYGQLHDSIKPLVWSPASSPELSANGCHYPTHYEYAVRWAGIEANFILKTLTAPLGQALLAIHVFCCGLIWGDRIPVGIRLFLHGLNVSRRR